MKRRLIAGLFALTMGAAATGHAELRSGAFSLSPFAGGYTFDGEQHLETAPTFGLRGAYHLDKNWAAELGVGYTPTKQTQGAKDDVHGYRYGLDLLYHFMPNSKLVPFLAAGFGGITVDMPRNDLHDVYGNYGAGLKYFLTENLALRGDARHIVAFNNSLNNYEYTGGVSYLFGGERPAPAKAVPPPAPPKPEPPKPEPAKLVPAPVPAPPADTDGDGVIDSLDKCPGTPAGVKVDSVGCPLDTDGDGVYDYLDKCPGTPKGVKVDSVGCPLDTDGDGVYDYLDKCPGTPAGVKVDSVGCPLDTDGDGVFDYLDKCPNTPKEAAVDKDGCPERICITLKLEFDTDKAIVKSQYNDEIKRVSDFLNEYPEATAEIEGHTDSVGSEAYNQKLSQRRAQAVVKYLVDKFGIKAERLSAKGYGESKPIADNATEAGRQKNRRVVANIDCGLKKRK